MGYFLRLAQIGRLTAKIHYRAPPSIASGRSDNGARVIGRTSATEVLSGIKGGGALEIYLGAKALEPFINKDLILERFVPFRLQEVEGLVKTRVGCLKKHRFCYSRPKCPRRLIDPAICRRLGAPPSARRIIPQAADQCSFGRAVPESFVCFNRGE